MLPFVSTSWRRRVLFYHTLPCLSIVFLNIFQNFFAKNPPHDRAGDVGQVLLFTEGRTPVNRNLFTGGLSRRAEGNFLAKEAAQGDNVVCFKAKDLRLGSLILLLLHLRSLLILQLRMRLPLRRSCMLPWQGWPWPRWCCSALRKRMRIHRTPWSARPHRSQQAQ